MHQKSQIAFGLDRGYLLPTAVALYALFKHNPAPMDIHIFAYDLTEADFDVLRKIAAEFGRPEPIFHPFTSDELQLPEHGLHYISSASYLRLFMPQYLSGRVTYLDGDILIRGSIRGLIEAKIEPGHVVAAVRDASASRFDFRARYAATNPIFLKKHKAQLAHEGGTLANMLENTRLENPQNYFNAGIFTIDFDRLKADRTAFAAFQSVEGAQTIGKGSDQRYLNALLRDRVTILPFIWNAQIRNFKPIDVAIPANIRPIWQEARQNPRIVHFVSKRKPWRPLYKIYSWSARRWIWEYKLLMREMRSKALLPQG